MHGLLVTGTDTGVGKTVVASVIAATLAARGLRVGVLKPALTGADEPGEAPLDDELLHASARSRQALDEVAPYRFGLPVSPHLAAELEGIRIDSNAVLEAARAAGARSDVLVVEGVGGLLVPLAPGYLVRDFAIDLGFPVVVAARPGLGTISHSLLTIEAARAVGLSVAGVVLTPWPAAPGAVELSNRATIAKLGRVDVATLPALEVRAPMPAVDDLPLDAWLSAALGRGRGEAALA